MTKPTRKEAQDSHDPSREDKLRDALLDISNLVGSVMELHDILQAICEITARVLETDTCSLYLRGDAIDRDGIQSQSLVLRATHGLRRERINHGAFAFGEGIPGWAAAFNRTAIVTDARKDPRYATLDDGPDEFFVAYVCVPLRVQEEVTGVLSIRRRKPTEWTEREVTFAEIIAKQVAIVIEKARLYQDKLEAERLAAIAVSLSETAHSIKNMLHGMAGGAYFVEQGIEQANYERILQGWEILKRNQLKIQRLVENMLNYSRSAKLSLEEGDINNLLETIVAEVAPSADFSSIALELSLDRRIPPLMLDPVALHDALLNLITNALDAIPPNHPAGVVSLRTRLSPDVRHARIEIEDNGTGIPPEVRDRLFKLFFTTKGTGGTGIGLAVTRKIIEEHGGRIGFDTVVGEGTTFHVELPLRSEAAALAEDLPLAP